MLLLVYMVNAESNAGSTGCSKPSGQIVSLNLVYGVPPLSPLQTCNPNCHQAKETLAPP